MMVSRDLEAIQNSFASATGALAGLVIATNPLARNGAIEFWEYPGKSLQRALLKIAPNSSEIERANPLATRAGLEGVLNWVGTRFDPRKHSFILFTKSHGTDDLLLTPRLVTRASVGRTRILSIARGETALGYSRPGVRKSEFLEIIGALGKASYSWSRATAAASFSIRGNSP